MAALLRDADWYVNDQRVERLWQREGLKVPMKQPRRERLWLNGGSCVRWRPEYRNNVWSYDFVHCQTDDGRVFRMLYIIDEFSLREAQILIEERGKHYNAKRPHSALGYSPPAPETIILMEQRPITH